MFLTLCIYLLVDGMESGKYQPEDSNIIDRCVMS